MVEDLPLITNAECNSIYGIVGDGVVCMDTEGGKGTCNGDSGGPLGHYDPVRERWVEFGIVSFGASAGCEVRLSTVNCQLSPVTVGGIPSRVHPDRVLPGLDQRAGRHQLS